MARGPLLKAVNELFEIEVAIDTDPVIGSLFEAPLESAEHAPAVWNVRRDISATGIGLLCCDP